MNHCPICGHESHDGKTIDAFRILECVSCKHQFLSAEIKQNHAENIFNDSYFYEGGAGYRDYTSEGGLLIQHGRRYAGLVAVHTAGRTMLDVGAAAGFIMRGFQVEGWDVRGIEPNTSMACYGHHHYGLEIEQCTLESTSISKQFDIVTLIQVIAHLVNPDQCIERVSQLTLENGLCLVETWDASSITAKVFGKMWHEYSPPSVLHWFNPGSLDKLMNRHGFRLIERGRPEKYLKLSHALFLLKHKLKNPMMRRAIALLENFLPNSVTLRYPAEDLFWALYKKY